MAPKDQTRLRVEKMEADRRLRRRRTLDLRTARAAEERRHLDRGDAPADVEFAALVREWREEHGGLARPHGDPPSETDGDADKIVVCVRKRPLNARERRGGEHDAVTCLHPTATVHSARLRVDGISKYCDHHSFRFDHAFDEEASTEEVYEHAAAPLVRHVCRWGAPSGSGGKRGGRGAPPPPRATVFAYGQTGSGKTFTMGGIQRRVVDDVFRMLSDNALDCEGRSLENTSVSVAMFELYGGRVQDLLNGRNRLRVLEDGRGEVVVSGLEEYPASNPRDFLQLVERGGANRTTHATEANDASSRSHAVARILLRDRSTGRLKGKLSLVDLAGSERGSDTKSHDRARRTESSEINTSLLALKECIRAIDAGGGAHVPYRQSKLTLILKDCFAGRAARTAMIATLSPGSGSTDHTVNTLRYADRIKEKKVGNVFSPSARSPKRTPAQTGAKQSPARKQPAVTPAISDDCDNVDFHELDEIMNEEAATTTNECAAETAETDADDSEQKRRSEIDRTVQELFEEEERLLNLHMSSIHLNASLLTEEGALLSAVQGDDCDVDAYAARLGEILDRKTEALRSLRDRLGNFRELLRREEVLAGLR